MTRRTRKNRTKNLTRLLLSSIAIYMLLRWFEHSQVYQPAKDRRMDAADFGRPFEDLFFPAADGVRLHAWFFPGATNSPRAQLAVLFCHGNGGNISYRPGYYEAILKCGVGLFTFDFRGYGRSEGKVSEAGTYLDVQGAFSWLKQKGFAATNILAWGESLGGGIASDLAVREPIGGLILQSSFTSVTDIGAELFPWLPVRSMTTIKYDTHSKMPRVKCPVLIMHSRADTTIPFQHAERNFAAANEPKLLWELHGDHNDSVEIDPQRYVDGFEKFLRLVEAQRGNSIKGGQNK